jgi:hypothetical protein
MQFLSTLFILLSMLAILQRGIILIIIALASVSHAYQNPIASKNIILIKGIRSSYLPFSAIEPPVLDVTNDQFNISVTDRKGNMLQINGINLRQLQNGILSPSQFQTVILWARGETVTDDGDNNSKSLLEIKCSNPAPGNLITVGLKTTIIQKGKKHRLYATLSGIIPSYQYQRTN